MSAARDFQRTVGSELAELLGNDVQYVPSRLLFRWRGNDADNLVSLSGSNKWSPSISMAFYFGRRFHRASEIEKATGIRTAGWHISQYSLNLRLMKCMRYGGPHSWEVDITHPPPNLVLEMAEAIRGMAHPFFERFSDMRAARDALEAGDSWCPMVDAMWSRLLYLNVALDDLERYEKWAEKTTSVLSRAV